MSTDLDIALIGVVVAIAAKKKNARYNRSKWSKDWLLRRSRLSHVNLINELRFEPTDWNNYLRMDELTYFELLNKVTPLIKKEDTNMRESITPHERLSATLRFLATGCSYETLKFSTVISPQALGKIIPETCKSVIKVLKEYLQIPETQEEWKSIAMGFETRWQFPHCLGSVDGKYIKIKPPPGSGSLYWNYKNFHSVVLMAAANSNYEFIWAEAGTNGRISDGGVINNTVFYQKLISESLNLPPSENCSKNGRKLPYVFIGDEAFALRADFLKPFSQRDLTRESRIFNYRLSRARRVIENIFGIMANRFCIFNTAINLKLDTINLIVLTCCVLHNFLRKKVPTDYCAEILLEDENDNGAERFVPLQRGYNRNYGLDGKKVRHDFMEYFNNEGQVEWQDKIFET